ncbi:MAG: glycosyltransferase family protein [Solirubrobacterales bacterium]
MSGGPEVVFAFTGGQNAFHRELAEALSFELGRLGARSRVVVDEFPAPTEGRVVVLLPAQEFAEFGGVVLAPALLARCIALSPEQLQLGYSEFWDGREDVAERDIDVLFLGRASERRERALAGYADLLERFRCEFVLADPGVPNAHEGPSFVTGENKRTLLARSKVLLNVHAEEGAGFEWLRAAEAISCGCAVVSEHAPDLAPLRPGTDLLTGSLDSLAYLAAWVAEDDERRAELAREAEASLRARPLADAAAKLLDAARRVDAQPAASQVASQARVVGARLASVPVLRPDLLPPSPESAESIELKRALQVIERQDRELQSLRRRLEAAEPARIRPDAPAPRTVEKGVTPAESEATRPLVSAIVRRGDDASVAATLESVRRSTMRSWEVLVGDAGAERAHGELLLLLDPGSLIRPFGMARLVAALTKDPGADLAYGLLDRREGDKPVAILDKFGWDLQRLQRESYIEPPVMIRRRVLFELGGYREAPDLLQQMAASGRRATVVRQFVGSCRVR